MSSAERNIPTAEAPDVTDPIGINLNHNVLVRVRPEGEELWRQFWAETGQEVALPRDNHGYTQLELHQVAAIFGPGMTHGFASPIDPEFIVLPGPTEEQTRATGQIAAELDRPPEEVPRLHE